MTQPESMQVLKDFYKKIKPGGYGWQIVQSQMPKEDLIDTSTEMSWSISAGILAMLLGCFFIYGCLFSTGYWIYGETTAALIASGVTLLFGFLLLQQWRKMSRG